MTLSEYSADIVNIVVRGHFNPTIISPGWLLAEKLISADDFTESQVEIIAPELSRFQATWLQCQVTPDTLLVSTADPSESERLRDLAVGILRTLRHTPVAALGINRVVHFGTESAVAWHTVGDILSPKDIWDGVLRLPGTQSVTILGVRQDDQRGRVQVSIEPSVVVALGIYVAHNDHFALSRVDSQPGSREDELNDPPASEEPTAHKLLLAIEILGQYWNDSMQRALTVVGTVKNLADTAGRN